MRNWSVSSLGLGLSSREDLSPVESSGEDESQDPIDYHNLQLSSLAGYAKDPNTLSLYIEPNYTPELPRTPHTTQTTSLECYGKNERSQLGSCFLDSGYG